MGSPRNPKRNYPGGRKKQKKLPSFCPSSGDSPICVDNPTRPIQLEAFRSITASLAAMSGSGSIAPPGLSHQGPPFKAPGAHAYPDPGIGMAMWKPTWPPADGFLQVPASTQSISLPLSGGLAESNSGNAKRGNPLCVAEHIPLGSRDLLRDLSGEVADI